MIVDDTFKEIIGKKILGVYGKAKGDLLQFKTDQGLFSYQAFGQCCSESWFEHISGLDHLINHTIISYEEIPMAEIPQSEQRESDQAYGYQFKTDKGYFLIEMRNSSNGYYGGDVDYSPIKEINYSLLTEDF